MLFKDEEVDAQGVQLRESTVHTFLHAPAQVLSQTRARAYAHEVLASHRGQHYWERLYESEKANRE